VAVERPLVRFITDDRPLARLVAERLLGHGLSLEQESPGAWAAVGHRPAALVLVDVAAPGVEFERIVADARLRAAVPVLVLTVEGDPMAAAGYLDAGADDCIVRPVQDDEVAARIRAVLRRSHATAPREGPLAEVRGLHIDRSTRTVVTNAAFVPCTAAEYDILERLARSAGEVVSRDELSLAACGRPASPFDRSVDVHISHLRRKLRHHGRQIMTVRGIGYMLAP
jgi:two-component system, OmpR family, response regulator CpxR